ncbi:flagellar basal body-associated FliL family protein [Actibacterium sp. D379-3]
MADPDLAQEEPPKKKSKLPLLLGFVLAIVLGGAGFFVMYSGMLGGGSQDAPGAAADHGAPAPLAGDIAFVPLDPLIISLGPGASNRHLKFTAQLEVSASHAGEVRALQPRVLDVFNGYLRAVSVADLEDPSALIRLRAQMLRRVQIVTGEGRVRDLLITEFVLN